MCINTSFLNIEGWKKIFILFPLFFSIILFIIAFFSFENILNFILISLIFFILFFYFSNIDLRKFQLTFADKILCYFIIILANLSFVLGNLFCFIGMQKILSKEIYRKSKKI